MIVHDFERSKAESRRHDRWPGWERIYRQAFSDFVDMQSTGENLRKQRLGIDRIVRLRNGKEISIDEKVRPTGRWKDILLETWSDERRGVPGWICKPLACDYIAYAIIALGQCHLLPLIQLQAAWSKYGRQWTKTYREKRAQNRGYVTVSVAVPIPVLYAKIGEQLRIPFDSSDFPHSGGIDP